jgi:hypothetical protein
MRHTHYLLTEVNGENIAVIARIEDYTSFFWNKVERVLVEAFSPDEDELYIIDNPDSVVHEEITCEFSAEFKQGGEVTIRDFILSEIELY